jgi:hypothetical protein
MFKKLKKKNLSQINIFGYAKNLTVLIQNSLIKKIKLLSYRFIVDLFKKQILL